MGCTVGYRVEGLIFRAWGLRMRVEGLSYISISDKILKYIHKEEMRELDIGIVIDVLCFLSLCLSTYLPTYLPTYLSIYLSIYRFVCVSCI